MIATGTLDTFVVRVVSDDEDTAGASDAAVSADLERFERHAEGHGVVHALERGPELGANASLVFKQTLTLTNRASLAHNCGGGGAGGGEGKMNAQPFALS